MDEISREESFVRMLQALIKSAQKNRGVVTSRQIEKAFDGMQLSKEQLQQVKNYLKDNKIGIDEPLDAEGRMSREDHEYLADYQETVASIEQPSDGVFDAIKLNAMAGDKEAQQQLAELMLPKVVDIAKLYAGQGVYMEDLIGAGNMALVRGTKLLGPLEKPEEVEPDLAQRIMKAMEDLIEQELEEHATAADAAEKSNQVLDKANELSAELGRKVTVGELAAEGELSEEEIMDAIRITGNHIDSIDYKA